VVKGRRFTWILEKSVELGVHEIWPMQTDRTVVVPGSGKQTRWRTILRTALKQSGRAFLPRLQPVTDLTTCLRKLQTGWIAYGDLTPDSTDTTVGPLPLSPEQRSLSVRADPGISPAEVPPRCVWVVGPEGGWSEAERNLLAEKADLALNLGPYRLRTETAATSGLILVQIWRQSWWPGSPDQPLP
jgi:16S rRNA (uracil1498-N3)-methyltransferase